MDLNPANDEVLGFQVVCGTAASRSACALPRRISWDSTRWATKSLAGVVSTANSSIREPFARVFSPPIARTSNARSRSAISSIAPKSSSVLPLEGGVKLKEVWTLDIPMGKMGLGHQGIGIGQNGLKTFDHCVGFLLGRCVCAHGG